MKVHSVVNLFPASLTIQVVPALKRAVLFLEIPTTKNSVTVGPFLTNVRSLAVVRREQILRSFDEAYRSSPMDYGETIGDESLKVVVQIESRESLLRRVHEVEDWYPDDAKSLRLLVDKTGLLPIAKSVELALRATTSHVSIDWRAAE